MTEQAFGRSRRWSIGVEEELMILDAESLELAAEVERFLEPGLKRELLASMLETNTGICESPMEALEELRRLRARAAEIAGAHGLAVAAAGSHPFSRPEDQPIANDPYYREFAAYAGPSARRQSVFGLHVHVGMGSGDECIRALEGVLPWLPLVLALSANSPYFRGEETGLASNRAEILAQLPRSGAPPPVDSYADFERFVERWIRIGLLRSYTSVWWDVRPAPTFGTLEIRVPDQPTSVELAAALAALLQALCVAVLEREPVRANRADYAQNRWAALRFGVRAELVHPSGDRLVGVGDLAQELLELVAPVARALGTTDLLGALDPSRCEGDRQLGVGRGGDLRAVCSDLVERSLAWSS